MVLTRSARGCTCTDQESSLQPARWTARLHHVLTETPEQFVCKAAVAEGGCVLQAKCKLSAGCCTQFKMSLGVTNFQTQTLPRARQTVSAATSIEHTRCRTLSARGLPKRMMHSPTVFPGEDAPGTGKTICLKQAVGSTFYTQLG